MESEAMWRLGLYFQYLRENPEEWAKLVRRIYPKTKLQQIRKEVPHEV